MRARHDARRNPPTAPSAPRSPARYEDDTLLVPLLNAAAGKLGAMSPNAIVTLVHALGELGLPHQALLDAVTDREVPTRLREFKQDGLADLVRGARGRGGRGVGLPAWVGLLQ